MQETQSVKVTLSPEQLHRREVFWQVILPALFGAGIFIAICVWVVMYTIGFIPDPTLPDQQSSPAKVAIIWILLPTCFGGLIQLAFLGGLVFLHSQMIRGLPNLSHKVLSGVNKVSKIMQDLSDKAAAPVISVASAKAGWDRFLEHVTFWKHSEQGD